MLRAPILYLSEAKWAKNAVTNWSVARRVSKRFVAGESEMDAVQVVHELNARGIRATCDVLGESVTSREMALAATEGYLYLIDCLAADKLDSTVSLKLTQFGLDIDEALCRDNMHRILTHARDRNIDVTIDMEASDYTQRTIDFFRSLRSDGFENVGTVIQAYLYRSEKDIEEFAAEGATIRLCKGAYKEPDSVAYPKKSDVDAAYVREMKVLLDAAKQGHGFPGIATHDAAIIDATKAHAAANNIPPRVYEFQMLYGIRSNLQDQLAKEGYGMRVYVPVGTEWYPYFMRRLAERPANLWFFASNFFRR
jgi:proline dehydrogenase